MKYFFKSLIILFFVSASANAEIIYSRQQISIDSILNKQSFSNKNNRPSVGLVLSGGGARGIAHVGVLKAFEKHNIPIDLIIGTSIGSIVGGLYCSGYSAEELEIIVK